MEIASSTAADATQDVQLHQKHHGRKPDLNRFLSDLTQNLNLTDDQASQIKTILEENAPDPSKAAGAEGVGKQPDESKFDEINEKIKSVLTDSQKTEFDSFIQNIKQHRHVPPSGDFQQTQQAVQGSSTVSANDVLLNTINASGAVAVTASDNNVDFYA